MTQQAYQEVLSRMASDPAFAKAVETNPTQALAGYDLTAAEIAAITGHGSSPSRPHLPDAKGMS